MRCHVEGCGKDAMYKAKQLCQMHYFRMMRTGSTTKESRKRKKIFREDGYISIYNREHPLADATGYVFEHRYVMWPVLGQDCAPCELCKKPLTWRSCHIDHINKDRGDNSRGNLRPLCCKCNTWRDYPPQAEIRNNHRIEFDGIIQTPAEWARDPRVKVAGRTIIFRKGLGMSDFDALFSERKTHKNHELKKACESAGQ